jgi:medium-chain acyl-[acyl-carrier-protein] hydrolase
MRVASSGTSASFIPSHWTLFEPSEGAAVQLVCFPYAGGHSGMFKSWASALTPIAAVYGAQPPGRGARRREPFATTVAWLAEDFGSALAPILRKPFCLFGHSLGATVAFETARWLARHRGLTPCHLFISAQRPPDSPQREPERSRLSDEGLVASLSTLNGTPPEVLENPELLQFVLPPLRADFHLAETYEYVEGQQLTCAMTVFAGTNDEESDNDLLEGWRRHTVGPTSIRWFSGDHFFINACQHQLLDYVRDVLERCAEG